ncbi:MAG TPA: hypothetical protein VF523_07445 [Burkholderiales bacterium]
MEALRSLLVHPDAAKGRATIILSSQFVRYMVLPSSVKLLSAAEEREFARARFVQIYGQSALEWTIALSVTAFGTGRLCAAVDRALVGALATAVATSRLRLVSVQPVLMALFNESRRSMGGDCWLVIAEPERLLVAWICAGQWRSVRMRPLGGGAVILAEVLEQERLLLAAGGGQEIFLASLGDVVVHTDGLKIIRLAPRTERPDANFALAMCGL